MCLSCAVAKVTVAAALGGVCLVGLYGEGRVLVLWASVMVVYGSAMGLGWALRGNYRSVPVGAQQKGRDDE